MTTRRFSSLYAPQEEKEDEAPPPKRQKRDEFLCRALTFQNNKLRLQALHLAAYNDKRFAKHRLVVTSGFVRIPDAVRQQTQAMIDEQDPRNRVHHALEVITLGADHPVKALQGQKGVRAVKNIKRHTVLCEYYGDWLSHSDAMKQQHTNMYLYDCLAKTPGMPDTDLTVDASQGNGVAEFINDFRVNIDKLDSKENDLRRVNAAFYNVRFKGETFVFIIAIDDIPAGADILLDYGDAYWQKDAEDAVMEKEEVVPVYKHWYLNPKQQMRATDKAYDLYGLMPEELHQIAKELRMRFWTLPELRERFKDRADVFRCAADCGGGKHLSVLANQSDRIARNLERMLEWADEEKLIEPFKPDVL